MCDGHLSSTTIGVCLCAATGFQCPIGWEIMIDDTVCSNSMESIDETRPGDLYYWNAMRKSYAKRIDEPLSPECTPIPKQNLIFVTAAGRMRSNAKEPFPNMSNAKLCYPFIEVRRLRLVNRFVPFTQHTLDLGSRAHAAPLAVFGRNRRDRRSGNRQPHMHTHSRAKAHAADWKWKIEQQQQKTAELIEIGYSRAESSAGKEIARAR